MWAMKQYFNFAQEQLRQAVGSEVAGSMALEALGKLHARMAEKANPEIALPEAKAVTFLQACAVGLPAKLHRGQRPRRTLAHKKEYAAARSAQSTA